MKRRKRNSVDTGEIRKRTDGDASVALNAKHVSDYRSEERSFVQIYMGIVALAIVFSVITRAPTVLNMFGMQGIQLKINVGYIISFGPWILASLVLWRLWSSVHLKESRFLLRVVNNYNHSARWLLLIFYMIPSVGSIFLFRQFVFETTVPGVDCVSFNHYRLFWDFSLLSSNGLQLHYCFGLRPEQQADMPYFFPPLQVWAHLLVSLGTIYACIKLWNNSVEDSNRS